MFSMIYSYCGGSTPQPVPPVHPEFCTFPNFFVVDSQKLQVNLWHPVTFVLAAVANRFGGLTGAAWSSVSSARCYPSLPIVVPGAIIVLPPERPATFPYGSPQPNHLACHYFVSVYDRPRWAPIQA